MGFFFFLAVLSVRCCSWAFSSHGEQASHCGGPSCWGAQALGTRVSVVCRHMASSRARD